MYFIINKIFVIINIIIIIIGVSICRSIKATCSHISDCEDGLKI